MSLPPRRRYSGQARLRQVDRAGPDRHRRRLPDRHRRRPCCTTSSSCWLGLFVVASGITLLQVAANPLIASMGEPKNSSFRLNLSQAFNSLGAACGLWISARSSCCKGRHVQEGRRGHPEPCTAMGLGFVTERLFRRSRVGLAVFTLADLPGRAYSITAAAPKMAEHRVNPFTALTSKWANLGRDRHLPLCRRRGGDLAAPAAVPRADPASSTSRRNRSPAS